MMVSNADASEKSHINIVMSRSEKGMIKKVIAGNKPVAESCLAVLNTLVEFGIDDKKLRDILKNLK